MRRYCITQNTSRQGTIVTVVVTMLMFSGGTRVGEARDLHFNFVFALGPLSNWLVNDIDDDRFMVCYHDLQNSLAGQTRHLSHSSTTMTTTTFYSPWQMATVTMTSKSLRGYRTHRQARLAAVRSDSKKMFMLSFLR